MNAVGKMDISDYLDSEETIAEYLGACLEDENPDVFLAALANVAKARGMSRVADASGLGRESLYKALAPGAHPRYETIQRLVHALGLQLTVKSLEGPSAAPAAIS